MGKKVVIFIIILVLGTLTKCPVFARYDGWDSNSESQQKQKEAEQIETLSGRYYVCDETGSSINEISVNLLKPETVFSAGDKGKKTVFVISDDKCSNDLGAVSYVSVSNCLSKEKSKIYNCGITTNKIAGCANVGLQKTDCKEIKVARYYAGNTVGVGGENYATTKDTPLLLDMGTASNTYSIRIPVVKNATEFVKGDFGWTCTGCDENLKFLYVENEPTVVTVKVTGGSVLGLKTLTINTEQKNLPADFKSIDPSVGQVNSLTFYVKLFVNCQPRLTSAARCNDDTNQEKCKKLCEPNGDADYCYYVSRNKCVDKANVKITHQDEVNWHSETNYAKPDDYEGFLPNCAFSGTCRHVNDLVNVAISGADWVFGIMGSVAFLFFIYGGFMMIFSLGASERVATGKNIIMYAIIGMVISLTAYMLVNFLLNSLGVSNIFRVIK